MKIFIKFYQPFKYALEALCTNEFTNSVYTDKFNATMYS